MKRNMIIVYIGEEVGLHFFNAVVDQCIVLQHIPHVGIGTSAQAAYVLCRDTQNVAPLACGGQCQMLCSSRLGGVGYSIVWCRV